MSQLRTTHDIIAILVEAFRPPCAVAMSDTTLYVPWTDSPAAALRITRSKPVTEIGPLTLELLMPHLGVEAVATHSLSCARTRIALGAALGRLHALAKIAPATPPHPWNPPPSMSNLWQSLTKPTRPRLSWSASSRDLHDSRLLLDDGTKATLTVAMTPDGTWRWRTSKPVPTGSPTEYEALDAAKAVAEDFAYKNLITPFPLRVVYDLAYNLVSTDLSDGTATDDGPFEHVVL